MKTNLQIENELEAYSDSHKNGGYAAVQTLLLQYQRQNVVPQTRIVCCPSHSMFFTFQFRQVTLILP